MTISASSASGREAGGFPPRIPDHELLRCIGEGSYGEVWLARNVIGTYRAVKIVFRASFETDKPFEREFSGIKKFEPISRTHPGLVDILQVGREEDAGYFYYVMEVADDVVSGQEIVPNTYVSKTLALELNQRGRLPSRECLSLGLSLSSALSHLHKNGLIHRDIKPSNIIFVDGHPKLADIGLVAEMSEARSFVGTEGFIPPEGPGTPQADIYSLGKVLYEIATGKDRQAFPELPTAVVEPATHKDFLELNEVILKSCAAKVQERHQTADELHGELKLLEAGQSVRRLRVLEKRMARLTKLAAIALILVLLGGLAFFQIDRNRKREAELRQRRVGSYVANGTRAVEDANFLGALPLFVEALKLDRGDARRAEVHRVRLAATLSRCPRLSQIWFLKSPVNFAEYSRDGKRLLVVAHEQTQVLDVASGQRVSPSLPYLMADTACFSLDERRIAVSGGTNVIVFDAATGRAALQLPHAQETFCVRFHPDGSRILTACANGAHVWDAVTGEHLLHLDQHRDVVHYAEYSHDGRFIATADHARSAWVWDAVTGERVMGPLEHGNWVYCACFSPDDQRLVTSSFDQTARIWGVPSGRQLLWPFNHPAAVRSARFSPDGRYIACSIWDQTTRIWDSYTGKLVAPVLNHSATITHTTFSPDGRFLATTAVDGTVRIWDLALPNRPDPLTNATFAADGHSYVVVSNEALHRHDAATDKLRSARVRSDHAISQALLSADGRIALTISPQSAEAKVLAQSWDMESGEPRSPPFTVGSKTDLMVLDAAGERLLTVATNRAAIWETATGRPIASTFAHPAEIVSAVFHPAGNRFATVCSNRAYLHETATGRLVGRPLVQDRDVYRVVFAPDGRHLLVLCRDFTLDPMAAQLWDCQSFEPVGPPLLHQDGVLNAAFSPDGKRVATAGEDDCVIVWETSTGRRLTPGLRHFNEVYGVAFSPDGRWIVSASRDSTARVWDAETGEPLTPALPHSQRLREAQFLAGNRRFVTRDATGTCEIWDLPQDAHSIEDLSVLAHLLSASTTHFSGGLMPLATEEIERCRNQIRHRSPADFVPTPADIRSWHLREARLNETQKKWRSAVWHLERLLEAEPNHPDLRRRRDAARAELAKGTAAPPDGASIR